MFRSSSQFSSLDESKYSISKNLRATLFCPAQKQIGLNTLPSELLELVGPYLNDEKKSLVKLALTSKAAYQIYYPAIKTILVQMLKILLNHDDLIAAEKLFRLNPFLLLRVEEGDPTGSAYAGFVTTSYQDTLLDPLLEETREFLEDCFPGTQEEKRMHAASQANEFKDPRFDAVREKHRESDSLTTFAYQTWQRRYRAWVESGYAHAPVLALCEAWMRIGLVQKHWSMRLKKIVSAFDLKNNKDILKKLPRDLPPPHFYGDRDDSWNLNPVGCDLNLLRIAAEHPLEKDRIVSLLSEWPQDYQSLIRHGEGENATYYLYAPEISLDEDKCEWTILPLDDPNLIQLIQNGQTGANPINAVDFSKKTLPYSPHFAALYQFGASRKLHLGFGYSTVYTVVNQSNPGPDEHFMTARGALRVRSPGTNSVMENYEAIQTLIEAKAKRLAEHLMKLESHLPRERPKLKP